MKEGSPVCGKCNVQIYCDRRLRPETAKREPLINPRHWVRCRNQACDALKDDARMAYQDALASKNWKRLTATEGVIFAVECGAMEKPRGSGMVVDNRGTLWSIDDETRIYCPTGQLMSPARF